MMAIVRSFWKQTSGKINYSSSLLLLSLLLLFAALFRYRYLLSTIIFTITRGWHNRPGVAAVPIVSQNKKKMMTIVRSFWKQTSAKINYSSSLLLLSLLLLFAALFRYRYFQDIQYYCDNLLEKLNFRTLHIRRRHSDAIRFNKCL
jgi:hypothetical protein